MNIKLTDFVISDLHIGHDNILEYCRGEFGTLDHMHEVMIERWNSVVGPNDTAIILGDVTIGPWKKALPVFEQLNGTKHLIMGNHDTASIDVLMDWFGHIHSIGQCWLRKPTNWAKGSHDGSRAVFTHVPVHPQCMDRWDYNVHGHLHAKLVRAKDNDSTPIDARYINVSCEQLDYAPIRVQNLFSVTEKEIP